jgi:hypothetical protein
VCGGHAAERRYRLENNLPVIAHSGPERTMCENYSHDVWNTTGRDGGAFLRLAWVKTQNFLDMPEIWAAVSSVADELFHSLVINSRPHPFNGDVVQYAMPGHVAEYFMECAGCRFGMLREEQRCIDAASLRRRPISRQWRAKIEAALVDSEPALLEAAQ